MPNEFFPHTCPRCNVTDEARFTYAGPHIKQVCNGCGAYVKFFDKGLIPDVRAIREKIWFVSGKDLELVHKAMSAAEYIPGTGEITAKMQWWRVWLEVRKIIQDKSMP